MGTVTRLAGDEGQTKQDNSTRRDTPRWFRQQSHVAEKEGGNMFVTSSLVAALACASVLVAPEVYLSGAIKVVLMAAIAMVYIHFDMLKALWDYRDVPGPLPLPFVGNLPQVAKGDLYK